MNKIVLIILPLFCGAVQISVAQVNYYKLNVDVRDGFTRAYADVDSYTPLKNASLASFGIRLSPYFTLGTELQYGMISAGDSIRDPHQRFFRNAYSAVNMFAVFYPSCFFDERRMPLTRKIEPYLRLGAGVVYNRITSIKRSKLNANGARYVFPGDQQSVEPCFPVEAGLAHFFTDDWGYPRIGIKVAYQFTVTMAEGLDGYADPAALFRNKSPDMYGLASIGLTILFGPVGFHW
ncbi:hypothetical protein [Hufsiella ginkgonis]|uniref:Outer membrane beta-barrel protein n=1 Tax=Hufsiella ginkgonis TaxID=2695274 RepID=A0A7K1XVC0_9SPHI|nr:hypothetical protein [Hufsiella ginkgonis]MXV14941.1 hypothetical protein [Hufsiella ginkgonis]